MKKWHFLLVFLPLLLSVSCDDGNGQRGYATVTVYNYSDFVVSDIKLQCAGWIVGPNYTLSELKQGESHKFNVELWEKNPESGGGGTIVYVINDQWFGVEHEEGAAWHDYIVDEGGCYYSPQYLKDGSKANIYIKNESYELTVEGGGYWQWPDGPPRL